VLCGGVEYASDKTCETPIHGYGFGNCMTEYLKSTFGYIFGFMFHIGMTRTNRDYSINSMISING
jgi:hypothetical protein